MSTPNPTSTDWVPLWDLDGGVGADLNYTGAYTGSKTYNSGAVVIASDGIAYVCVKNGTTTPPEPWTGITGPAGPPGPQGAQGPQGIQGPAGAGIPTVVEGKWLYGTGGAAIWADLPKPNYATTLPASPVDGQEAILVDSVTNPSYVWRFRYNAGSSSAYKWEYIGGSPAYSRNPATGDAFEYITTAVGTYGSTSTVGPQITVPRAGEYDVVISAYASLGTITNWTVISMIVEMNTAGNWVQGYVQSFTNLHPAVPYSTFGTQTRGINIPSAGTLLRAVFGVPANSGSGQPTIGRRTMFVTPVRVS